MTFAQSLSPKTPLEPVTLQLKWLYQFQFAGYIAAKEKGFYTEAGLDVTLKELKPDMNAIDEVLSGRAEYGVSGMGLLAHYANGDPVQALAAIFQHDALVLMSKASSGIVSPYELAGKRLMFDNRSGNDTIFRALLKDAGIDLSRVTTVTQTLSTDPLIQDQVDVMSGYITTQPYLLKQQGIELNIINPHNYGYDFYGDLLFTSHHELTTQPERAQRFLDASLKGWEYALAHPEEIIQLLKQRYHSQLTIEQLRYEARETQKLIAADHIPLGSIHTARLKRIAELYHEVGVAPVLSDKALPGFIYRYANDLDLTQAERDWLTKHPIIPVGVGPDFAPYSWIDDKGEYVGLAAEYIRLLETKLGVTFEFITDKPWHEILEMAQRGEVSILPSLNQTQERDKYLSFTAPYVTIPIVIVNADRHGFIGSLDKLNGKTVAVERGYFTHDLLKTQYPDIHLLVVNSTEQALNRVAAGQADAYLGDAANANYLIKKNDLLNLQFSGQTSLSSSYRIGVSKTQPELFQIIDRVMNSISSEELKRIEQQWLGLNIHTGISWRTILPFLLGFSVLLCLFSYWIYRLRQSKQALAESESRLKNVLDASPIPQFIHDSAGNIVYLNQAFSQSYGYSLNDFRTLDQWWQLAIAEPQKREHLQTKWLHHALQADASQAEFKPIETEILTQSGKLTTVIANATRVNALTENNTLVIFYDISERKQAEERLKLSGLVFNQAHEGILITDAKGLIVDINPAFSSITGYSREDVVGQKPSLLSSGKHSAIFYQEMWNSLYEKGYWQGEIWNRKKNGQLFAELLTISTLVDEQGETYHYLGLFSDITQSKEQQHTLELMAHYDMLTQLPNRSLFADRFKQAIAHSDRTNQLLAVVFLDLDGFKPVNDRYGHEVGDQLLIEVAQRLKANIRQEDTASRLGGDEFVLLLNDMSSVSHCERSIVRLREALEQAYLIDDESISLSASIGITLYPLDNADADTLLRHADQAMYQAKLAGRQRHHFFDTMQDQQLSQKQSRLQALSQAVSANQLVLFYQPKVNMRNGEVIGVEALLRWQHPEHGLLSPASFLPAIEGTELEIHIGNWVIKQAMQQLETWSKLGIATEVSINIASHHLQWKGFFEQLEQTLSEHADVPSNLLQLEILESSVLADIHHISSIIKTCRSILGLRISLDDFGTGYSSLTHLRHLPVDVVKIDQSFVRDLIDDPNDFTIIDGVISLTEAFHHQVIAEGVETVEQGLMLMTMGCELAQGFAIAQPMPADNYRHWLAHYQPNTAWLNHAQRQLTPKLTLIELMKIQSQYWFDRIMANLASSPDKVAQWPLMNHKKSHFSHWLGQAKKQQWFDEESVEQLKQAFLELYHEANSLKFQFQEGKEIDKATLNDLADRYQLIERLLNEQSLIQK